jgi:hypothetical protein
MLYTPSVHEAGQRPQKLELNVCAVRYAVTYAARSLIATLYLILFGQLNGCDDQLDLDPSALLIR